MTQDPCHLPLGEIICGEASSAMEAWPDGSVDCIITSPPYWNAVDYGPGSPSWASYDDYLESMARVWRQCARVLRPNGKLCINAPLLPIPQAVIKQQTRHLKAIFTDLEHRVLADTDLRRFSLFIWQKQTSKLMFGSYPFPGNLLENNTIEFIGVYVKPGKPPRYPAHVKEANRLTQEEWIDLTQQVWCMYPQDVRRAAGHPAPFPGVLPARLLRLYTFGGCSGFDGEVVADPFAGTGTTCATAAKMGRQWLGAEINACFAEYARSRANAALRESVSTFVGRPSWPTKTLG